MRLFTELVTGREQERHRLDAQAVRDPLDAAQREVALTALDRPHVRAVNLELVGERLLTDAGGVAMSAEVVSDTLLELAFHGGERSRSATERSTDL